MINPFGCGTFTVSLSIVDANGVTTETKMDYIVTDEVTPDFGNQLLGPNVVQFTDTSSPTPTSWDWDLDGDGVTDSTAPNPRFSPAEAGTYLFSVGVQYNDHQPYPGPLYSIYDQFELEVVER